MITELRLENWKSFGEATLYIDPLSILIGTNASGKTNVLRALFFLSRISAGVIFTDALGGGLDWWIRKPFNNFSLTIVIKENTPLTYSYRLDGIISDGKFECSNEYIYLNDSRFEIKEDAGSLAKLFVFCERNRNSQGSNEKAANIIRQHLVKIMWLVPNPHNMAGYSQLSPFLYFDASNVAGVLAALPPDKQKEVEDTITYYACRLPERDIHRMYAEKVGKLGKDAMLYCDEKWGESGEVFTVDARAMSDGTLRFLAILTALLTLPEGSLLAIDEVDNGFHPSRAHLLLEALQTIGKQRNIDVLVTTHNPALLDALGTEFLPFVTVAHRDSITGESKLTLLEDIEQLPKLLAQGTVGKLSTQGLIEKSLESVHG